MHGYITLDVHSLLQVGCHSLAVRQPLTRTSHGFRANSLISRAGALSWCRVFIAGLHLYHHSLLLTLDTNFKAGRISVNVVGAPLADLHSLLEEISRFVTKMVKQNFLKTLFTKIDNMDKIDGFNRRITGLIQAFQISALLEVHEWQAKNDAARSTDQKQLMAKLDALQNHAQLMEALHISQENKTALMVSLQRQIDSTAQSGPEYKFYSRTLLHLSALGGRQIEAKDWMVTTYEVDFGEKIGSGGFGDVYRGIWHKTEVALKVVRTGNGVIPKSSEILREIEEIYALSPQ
ncbi:hypothetical protein B0H19DRAFT_133767 [Mycena capillaripes]|nr:hypothetical protein B0H19DRAFT_133767 [Mycena capillaripes]